MRFDWAVYRNNTRYFNLRADTEIKGIKMYKTIIVILLIVVGYIGLITGVIYYMDKNACYSKYIDFQPEYHGVITGCLVQYNGKTVPVESLRVME